MALLSRRVITYSDGTYEIETPVPPSPVPTPVNTFRVPDTGEFFILRHDYQRADWGFRPRSISLNYKKDPPENPLPETVYLPGNKPGDFVALPMPWQLFWFELLNLASQGTKTYAERIIAWADLTANGRAFTDNHAVQNGFCDYVQGKNIGAKPIAHKSLGCGGNLVRRIGEHTSGKHVIEALNLSQPPPDPADAIKKPWLVQWATQETVIQRSNGTWRVTRFPQLSPYGTPFLIVSLTGTNLVETNDVYPIANGSMYSPYIP